jgi:hypothetical protein
VNLRRGLLRVWVVVSIVWVLFIVINGWDQLSEIFTAIEPPPGEGAVVLPPGPYECWATRHADNPFVIIQPGVETSANMSLTTAWRRCITYKLQIPMKALAPPLMLLALGLASSWVAKGFKTT